MCVYLYIVQYKRYDIVDRDTSILCLHVSKSPFFIPFIQEVAKTCSIVLKFSPLRCHKGKCYLSQGPSNNESQLDTVNRGLNKLIV